MNKVILITNQENVRQNFQEKFVLLRESDKLLNSDYESAPDILYEHRPNIVLLHENCNREKTINLIKYIKEKNIFANTHILLIAETYDKAFILNAYDEGIADYIMLSSDSSEILIRTINCIKKSEMTAKICRLEENLKTYGILDAKSGFYSANSEQNLFDIRLHMEDYTGGCYILLTSKANEEASQPDIIIDAIKKSVRLNDLVARVSDTKYAILLKCNIDGCIKVIEKIKENLPSEYKIRAGIKVIDLEKFEDIKSQAACALNNALLQERDFVIYSIFENTEEDWLAQENIEEKSYKLFQKAFLNKVQNIIAPVFLKTKKSYEEKVTGVKIEHFTDEQQSAFRVLCGTNESRLTMHYNNYTKLTISISHSGFDSPENKEITLSLKEITENKIEEILEAFMDEFIGIYRHLYRNEGI